MVNFIKFVYNKTFIEEYNITFFDCKGLYPSFLSLYIQANVLKQYFICLFLV